MNDEKKFNIKEWFFQGNEKPAAKSRAAKLINLFKVAAGEYRRADSGSLVHTKPRKFRRGRIHWQDGKQVGQFRWKFWTLKGRS